MAVYVDEFRSVSATHRSYAASETLNENAIINTADATNSPFVRHPISVSQLNKPTISSILQTCVAMPASIAGVTRSV
jgi:hypothetical protein